MELWRGLRTQARVIFALALRETRTRYGQNRAGYVWAILEPLFAVATFYVMFAVIGRTGPGGMELFPFLVTGILTYEIATKTIDRVSVSVEANKALLFYPQVQHLDLALARVFLELATYMLVLVVMIGAYALYTQSFAIQDPLLVLQGLFLAALFGLSCGMLLSSLTVVSQLTQRVKGPLMRPLFWISGLFFTADMVPLRVREFLLWNPILHCIEMVRDGWFVEYDSSGADPSFVLMVSVVLLFVGLTLERRVRAKVQLT